jgi:hypothetical protein
MFVGLAVEVRNRPVCARHVVCRPCGLVRNDAPFNNVAVGVNPGGRVGRINGKRLRDIMNLELKHAAIIAGLIAGVVTEFLAVRHSWDAIATPWFVAGVLMQIAAAITAIFVEAPGAAAGLAQTNKPSSTAPATRLVVLSAPADLGRIDPKRFLEPTAD